MGKSFSLIALEDDIGICNLDRIRGMRFNSVESAVFHLGKMLHCQSRLEIEVIEGNIVLEQCGKVCIIAMMRI